MDTNMTDQPTPEAEKPNPIQQITPDWQQIALLLLWKLLPAGQKTITIIRKDFADVMDSYHGAPVVIFMPTAESTLIGLATVEEAEALAAAYNSALPEQNAPAPGSLQ